MTAGDTYLSIMFIYYCCFNNFSLFLFSFLYRTHIVCFSLYVSEVHLNGLYIDLWRCTIVVIIIIQLLAINCVVKLIFACTVTFSCLKDIVISAVCLEQSPTKKPQVAERTRKVGF